MLQGRVTGAAFRGPFWYCAGLLLCGCWLAGPALAGADDGDDLMHREPWESCRYCHGAAAVDGTPPVPVIDGQVQGYIEKQLADFRSGARPDPNRMMASALVLLDPQDDSVVARYFSSQPPPATGHPQTRSPGASIYWNGRGERPACAGCHGWPSPQSPNPDLFGQGAAYLVQQLRGFATGSRNNDFGGMMQRVAGQLTEEDMVSVASYLAAQRPR